MQRLFHRGDSFPFDFNAILRAPRIENAVYFFWSESKSSFVYIGKTDRTLTERLREHRRDCYNPVLRAWIRYAPEDLRVCYVICPASLVGKAERRLIRQLDPDANIEHKT